MSQPPVNNPMVNLFREELKTQTDVLQDGLIALQSNPQDTGLLAPLVKAVHELKGAAKIVAVQSVADLAGVLESLISQILSNRGAIEPSQLTVLTEANEALREIIDIDDAKLSQSTAWSSPKLEKLIDRVIGLTTKPRVVKTVVEQGEAKRPQAPSVSGPLPLPLPSSEKTAGLSVDHSMLRLFFVDLENQARLLSEGVISLEANQSDQEALASLMRAAHSVKGAARVLRLTDLVGLSHAVEDCFVSLQKTQLKADSSLIDLLLRAVDLFQKLVTEAPEDIEGWVARYRDQINNITEELRGRCGETTHPTPAKVETPAPASVTEPEVVRKAVPKEVVPEAIIRRLKEASQSTHALKSERVLRLPATYLTRLMGLAGELLVESRWLQPFSDALLNLKRGQNELSNIIDILRSSFDERLLGDEGQQSLLELQRKTNNCRQHLAKRLEDLELFVRRHATLSDKLYREVISSRMCPFAEGIEGLPRMVRDLARQLGKRVRLDIIGQSTTIDRDILEKLKSPLNHLLRNAVDHGIEMPDEREASCKSAEGHIRLEARHRAGVLSVTVSDDGRGVDLEEIRRKIVERKLVDIEMARQLTENEILDFLFLPGFTTLRVVTDISGRGVGLNVVQSMVHEVGGQIRVHSQLGKGTTFQLALPLTLSVVRALLVEISGEPYAFPLARIERSLVLPRAQVQVIENRQYCTIEGQNVGLVPAHQVMELPEVPTASDDLCVIVLSDTLNYYGVVVDRLLGEKELVVQELDPRLGKVSDVSCGAFMEDGSPVLIIDVEDMVRSVDNLLSIGSLRRLGEAQRRGTQQKRKRILVVDDSITVREVECRILENQGYIVDVAVNGVDGWNSVRIEDYDLVITDIDMPRMNGIELVKAIKSDPRLRNLPVMIVSYKERGEDRVAGLEAGANYYLAKSSFHDDTFLQSVRDLIGEAG